MPTTITKTIGIGGTHDYTSLAAWEADTGAIPTDLVAGDNVCVGQTFFNGSGDGEFTGVGALLDIAGHTTDSTHTITLTTGSGQSFRDNVNVRSNALNYNAANGVAVRSSGNVDVITLTDTNCFISNIQVKTTGNYSHAISTGASCGIDNCIFYAAGNNALPALVGNSVILRNSLFIAIDVGFQGGVVSCNLNALFYFCTIVAPSDTGTVPNQAFTNPTVATNCAVFGITAIDNGGGGTVYTTCMTDVASPPTGFIGGKTYANQFQNTTTALGDWREKTGANLQGAGTADATNGATDISGLVRPQGSNWDIGAWELEIASSEILMGQAVM